MIDNEENKGGPRDDLAAPFWLKCCQSTECVPASSAESRSEQNDADCQRQNCARVRHTCLVCFHERGELPGGPPLAVTRTGEIWERIVRDGHEPCPDCGATPDSLHLDGCELEVCPNRGGTLETCIFNEGCGWNVFRHRPVNEQAGSQGRPT